MQETFGSPGPPLPLTSLWHLWCDQNHGCKHSLGVGQALKALKLALEGAEGRPGLQGGCAALHHAPSVPGVIFPDISAETLP